MVTNSVEILSTEQETWITGPPLDPAIEGPSMAILDGQLVLLGGKPAGLLNPSPLKQVLAITEDGEAWVDMGMELSIGRAFAGVATVPTTLFDDCPAFVKLADKDAVVKE